MYSKLRLELHHHVKWNCKVLKFIDVKNLRISYLNFWLVERKDL